MAPTPSPTLTQTSLPVFVNSDYAACGHAFDTTRKALEIRASLGARPIDGVAMVDPTDSYENAERIASIIHSGEYLDALRTGKPGHLATSQGFKWDADIWTMARAHLAGMIAAVDSAMSTGGTAGSLSSGMHHASYDSGCGYCTLNGVAGAAVRALELGAERVLVLDFDSHGGGGTWDIIGRVAPGRIVQVDVTVSPFDTWRATSPSKFIRAAASEYLPAIRRALSHTRKQGGFDVVVYNAGMDPINSGVSVADIVTRERIVRDSVDGTPAVFGLAGGYTWGHDMTEVVDWHRLTLSEWASRVTSPVRPGQAR